MSDAAQIDYECFEELVLQLQIAGHSATAKKLDELLHRVAWTTGSELLGELGLEILAFERATLEVGAELRDSLNRCIAMVRRAWPDIK